MLLFLWRTSVGLCCGLLIYMKTLFFQLCHQKNKEAPMFMSEMKKTALLSMTYCSSPVVNMNNNVVNAQKIIE